MFDSTETEETAVGWMSMADLFMVGLMIFLLAAGSVLARNQELAENAETVQSAADADRTELNELRSQQERWQRATSQSDFLTQRIQDLETRLAAEMQRLSAVLCEKVVIEDDHAQLQGRVADYLVTLTARQKKILEQEDLLRTLRETITAMRQELAGSQQVLAELRALVVAEGDPDDELIAEWQRMQKQIEELRGLLARQETQLQEQRLEFAGKNKSGEDLQVVIAELIEQMRRQQQEFQQVRTKEYGLRQELVGIRARDGRFGRVVFVVDRSGSMIRSSNDGQNTRWDYVQSVIEDWMTLLPFEEVQLILFNNVVDVYPQKGDFLSLSGATDFDRFGDAESRRAAIQPLLTVLRSTEPNQGTNTVAALRKAYEAKDVDAIFLFTDGQPMLKAERETTSEDMRRLQNEVLDLITMEQQGRTSPPINVIALGDYFNDRLSGPEQRHLAFGVFLTTIAQRTGGTFLGR
jgi:predicted  nucleic acid-binding Zn-ribbon protein